MKIRKTARSISIKNASGRTSLKHNNREKSLTNVDSDRTKYNRTLVKENLRDVYEREFGESLLKYNEKQKRGDRKIKDYFSHVRNSDSLELQREEIIQIGDKDNYGLPFSQKWEDAADMYESFFEKWKEKNPNLVPYNVVIHLDESSPHMHINYVPVAKGYKRGLEKQPGFSKALENQGFSGNKKQIFSDWRNEQVEIMSEIMSEYGVSRKLVGKNDFKNHYEYKKFARELAHLRSEKERLEKDTSELSLIKKRLEGKCERYKSEESKLELSLDLIKTSVSKNKEILKGQKEKWEEIEEKKRFIAKEYGNEKYINDLECEPFFERTITGKKEVIDKVVVSKSAFMQVEEVVNSAIESRIWTEERFKEELGNNKRLEGLLNKTKEKVEYWRNSWNKLNDEVSDELEPAVKQLDKFKDWALGKFEKIGYKKSDVVRDFESQKSEDENKKHIERSSDFER